MTPTITDEEIRSITNKEKARYDTNIYVGMCRSLATGVKKSLNKRKIPASRHEFKMGSKRVTHFAVTISLENYAHTDQTNGRVIIDPTISQFSLENQNSNNADIGLDTADNLPSVGIYLPNCEERIHWYHKPNDPRTSVDPFAETTADDTTAPEIQ